MEKKTPFVLYVYYYYHEHFNFLFFAEQITNNINTLPTLFTSSASNLSNYLFIFDYYLTLISLLCRDNTQKYIFNAVINFFLLC